MTTIPQHIVDLLSGLGSDIERPWMAAASSRSAEHAYQQFRQGEINTLVDLFAHSCKQYSDKTAYYFMGQALSYRQLQQHAWCVAYYLKQHLKLKASSRVGLMLPNCLHFPVFYWGILCAGLTVVTINPQYTAPELEEILLDADLSALVVLDLHAAVAIKAQQKLPLQHMVIAQLGDFFAPLKRITLQFILKYIKIKIPRFRFNQAINYRKQIMSLVAGMFQAGAAVPGVGPITPQSIAMIQYTGGTTGKPKGVMLSHANIVQNAGQCEAMMQQLLDNEDDCVLAALPFYHIYSLMICAISFMNRGAANLLIIDPRKQNYVIKQLCATPITVFVGINTLFKALLAHRNFKRVDTQSWKLSISGGMALAQQVNLAWRKRTGVPMVQGYGLSEASPVVSVNLEQDERRLMSIGQPLPATDVVLVDSQHAQLCGPGQPGELCVRGPQVMQGYWQLPGKTQQALVNGWLLTGDVATMDEQGYLHLVDRKKDMVIISGFNVYPAEVEAVLESHPQVIDAAVIGVKDVDQGEALKAFVVCRRKKPRLEELMDHCRQNLAAYKIPDEIVFKKKLPKSAIGKLQRHKLS